jgi:murein L,D-transpeptidase YafK
MRCRSLQALFIAVLAAVAGTAAPAESAERMQVSYQRSSPSVDRIVVRKGERRMYLMTGDEVLRSYRVLLGLSPVGRKDRSGDFRTPEGSYRLGRRNPRSDYFLSIQITYPNRDDIVRARRNGWQPGGSIMIHGLPNQLRREPEYYATQDWTNGCIAVSNADMLDIWTLVTNNTPIDIVP